MNTKRYILLTCLVGCLCTLQYATASGREESVVNLTINDGLTGETVHDIITDHSGLTWIATNSGINVFNGRQFHEFHIMDKDGQPTEVRALCETADSHIYAATDQGLWRMAIGVGHFELVSADVGKAVSLMAIGDSVYIGGEHGLMVFDGKTLKQKDVDVGRKGINNIVRQYARCEKGKIWFLGRFDLNGYDPRTDRITHYRLPQPLGSFILTQFTCLGNGRFAIGTRGNGLYLYDRNANTVEKVAGVGNMVSTVRRCANGDICVATDGAGAYLLEQRNGKLEIKEHFSADEQSRHQLPSNGVYCYYRDPNGVNWFGFVRYGLSYIYHSDDMFKPLKSGDFIADNINIRTYCRHGNDIILGTQNGFYHLNTANGTHRFFSIEELCGGHIVSMVQWYDDRFYLGTFDGGLLEYLPQTQTLQRQSLSPLLSGVSIGDLKRGPDGRLWIGCSHGLMIASSATGTLHVDQHFTEQNSHIIGGLILSITFDANGNAWMTGATGCSLYSVRSHEIVDTNFPKGFFNNEAWMKGASGHDGMVFFRTGPRTFYTKGDMSHFGEMRLPISFTDRWSRNFIDDMKGHYLLSSERGVFGFRYDLSGMVHFGYGEGLRGDFINDMGIDSDGKLWVATSQGLFLSTLEEFNLWRHKCHYKVRLYAMRHGSDMFTMREEYLANENRALRLTWNITSEVLHANVLLLDYAKSTGRIYEYRLDDGNWQVIDETTPIDIRGLMLGRHRLEVRLASAEETATTFTIAVVPSGWAIFELVLLILSLALLWIGMRYRKTTKVLLNERDEIEDILVEIEEKRQQEEQTVESKYERVRIDEEECEGIVRHMKEYIEREKVYTNADLKMKDLADVLHLSAPKLSMVFNLYLKDSYYEFINRYRLEEFKRLIAEGKYKLYTITALSEQCGFKKSNFFSTFRKVEGMTPMEYLKKQGVNIQGVKNEM